MSHNSKYYWSKIQKNDLKDTQKLNVLWGNTTANQSTQRLTKNMTHFPLPDSESLPFAAS